MCLGVTSPDGNTRLAITSHGAYRKAYIDKTKKDLWIWIGRGVGQSETELLQKRYTVVGSDICWITQWISSTEVTVAVFDYGDGVSSYDAKKSGAKPQHITTLMFRLNNQTGKFEEKK